MLLWLHVCSRQLLCLHDLLSSLCVLGIRGKTHLKTALNLVFRPYDSCRLFFFTQVYANVFVFLLRRIEVNRRSCCSSADGQYLVTATVNESNSTVWVLKHWKKKKFKLMYVWSFFPTQLNFSSAFHQLCITVTSVYKLLFFFFLNYQRKWSKKNTGLKFTWFFKYLLNTFFFLISAAFSRESWRTSYMAAESFRSCSGRRRK